jgi:hypothetical protein
MDDLDRSEDRQKQVRSRDLELLTIRQLMKTENGRGFMYRCLQNCCVFENIFDVDPVRHAYRAGLRDHGLWLERELKEASPDDYIKMLKEHING